MRTLLYRALKYSNDVRAVRRSLEQGTPAPVVRRAGRRVYGKLAGRLARKLFG